MGRGGTLPYQVATVDAMLGISAMLQSSLL